jgi:hypothetical protein
MISMPLPVARARMRAAHGVEAGGRQTNGNEKTRNRRHDDDTMRGIPQGSERNPRALQGAQMHVVGRRRHFFGITDMVDIIPNMNYGLRSNARNERAGDNRPGRNGSQLFVNSLRNSLSEGTRPRSVYGNSACGWRVNGPNAPGTERARITNRIDNMICSHTISGLSRV